MAKNWSSIAAKLFALELILRYIKIFIASCNINYITNEAKLNCILFTND